jgi:hypothetical protein
MPFHSSKLDHTTLEHVCSSGYRNQVGLRSKDILKLYALSNKIINYVGGKLTDTSLKGNAFGS